MVIGCAKRTKDGDKPKPTRFYSAKQEEAVAKATGGRRTLNSGATDFGGKSDVLSDKFALECKTKTTHSESISIKREWFEKQKQEAMFMNKPYSAIVFNFGPDEENHYIIDEYLFLELLHHLNTLEENI
jgi:hypothetical protein